MLVEMFLRTLQERGQSETGKQETPVLSENKNYLEFSVRAIFLWQT